MTAGTGNLRLVKEGETAGNISFTFNHRGTTEAITVPEGTTLGQFLDSIRAMHSLPDRLVAKVDDFVMEDGYALREGEQVTVTLAEIVYGPNSYDASAFVGQKLWAAIQACRDGLNMPADNEIGAEIAGQPAKLSQVIQLGDRIEVSKTKGRKL
jgi:hypothetical protein